MVQNVNGRKFILTLLTSSSYNKILNDLLSGIGTYFLFYNVILLTSNVITIGIFLNFYKFFMRLFIMIYW